MSPYRDKESCQPSLCVLRAPLQMENNSLMKNKIAVNSGKTTGRENVFNQLYQKPNSTLLWVFVFV
jgi:hypothetical protein